MYKEKFSVQKFKPKNQADSIFHIGKKLFELIEEFFNVDYFLYFYRVELLMDIITCAYMQ